MKILIFNWRDIKNPSGGGAEVFTHENAKRWVEKGHSVTLFTSAFPNCAKEEVIDGVKIIRFGSKYSVYLKAFWYYKKRFKGKFDVVIDEINTLPFFTPLYVREPVVALIHQLAREFWFYETKFPISFFGYLIEPWYLKIYKNIITLTVSNSTKQDLLNLGFSKVYIVPEGINFKPLDKVIEKEKDPTIIFVGRLKKAKLPDHAIKAFRIVKETLPNAKLWVVGDGYFREELEKISCDGVKFLGFVPEEKKLELMSRAHVLIAPALREGWGLIVTEANACGTPAIAYDVHGLRDSIKNDETGLLTENNPEALAEAIIKFFNDPNLRQNLTKKALKHAIGFNWDRSSKETLKIIKKVTNHKLVKYLV